MEHKTVGKAIIKQNDNEYISISRNEENIANLKREYPNVKCYVGNIEDKSLLLRVFKEGKARCGDSLSLL